MWYDSLRLLGLTIAFQWVKISWGKFPLSTKWACGAAGSALPWHGRGRRFDPDQVHQSFNNLAGPALRASQTFGKAGCVTYPPPLTLTLNLR